eukprot:358304-Chlamydomonas_euryale.AAC.3
MDGWVDGWVCRPFVGVASLGLLSSGSTTSPDRICGVSGRNVEGCLSLILPSAAAAAARLSPRSGNLEAILRGLPGVGACMYAGVSPLLYGRGTQSYARYVGWQVWASTIAAVSPLRRGGAFKATLNPWGWRVWAPTLAAVSPHRHSRAFEATPTPWGCKVWAPTLAAVSPLLRGKGPYSYTQPAGWQVETFTLAAASPLLRGKDTQSLHPSSGTPSAKRQQQAGTRACDG